jgi:hypothetical protein
MSNSMDAEAGDKTVKFLATFALITALPVTAMAQIPPRCKTLNALEYRQERNPNTGTPTTYAFIRNEDPDTLASAGFSFDLLLDDNIKIGEASANIGRLRSGDTARAPMSFSVQDDFKYFRLGRVYCNFIP